MLQAPKGGSERVDDATRLSKEIASDVPVRINDTEGSGKASLFPVLSILFLRKKSQTAVGFSLSCPRARCQVDSQPRVESLRPEIPKGGDGSSRVKKGLSTR
jgi:hypothetical protein